uniref:ERCC4 domain-containing protein n=1 Tax=viral metagenome TaxID=1070528 RepID=A0A6C0LXX3_9ZZZZ
MTIEMVIDNREHGLIKILEQHNPIIETLDIGDILFRDGDETVLIIERKTIADLKASICDGRSREQKARLLHSGIDVERITYLIEGDLDKPLTDKVFGLPVSTLIGSIINTQLRDGIKVYKTSSINETSEYLVKIKDKLQKDSEKFFKHESGSMSSGKYASTLKKKKKSNMTSEVWFISLLSLIPQITEKVAEQIVNVYPTVQILIGEYTRTPDHLCAKLLADIKFTLTTGKQRRIGDKASERIYLYFCPK